MKTIRDIHTYVACLFAPLTVFFLLSGALQTWNLHKARKDNTYKPPVWVAKVCHIHTDQYWPSDDKSERKSHGPFRIVASVLVAGMLNTVALGIVMAYRLARSKRRISLLLIAGTALPVCIILLQR